MESSNSERDNEQREEKIDIVVERLASFVYDGWITDDNPSPTNNKTSLEQIILFELDGYLDEKTDIEYIKACVTKEIGETNYEKFPDEDFGLEEDTSIDDDLSFTPDSFINQPEIVKDIKKIAEFIFLNIITKDNPSPENECNSLEQVISFHFSKYVFYNYKHDKDIVKGINAHLNSLNGGCNIYFGEKDIDILNEKDFPIAEL